LLKYTIVMKRRENSPNLIRQNRVFLWIALGTVALLLVPFIAMQFTDEAAWTWSDFVIAGLLVFGTGSAFVLTARKIQRHYLAIALLFVVAFVLVWVELAVGILR
jgi:hypothetical protein